MLKMIFLTKDLSNADLVRKQYIRYKNKILDYVQGNRPFRIKENFPAYRHIYLLLEVRIRLLLVCYRWHLDSKTFELRRARNCYLHVAFDQHNEYMHFVAVDWSLSYFRRMISRTLEETHSSANYSHEYWQYVTFVTSWKESELSINFVKENSKVTRIWSD